MRFSLFAGGVTLVACVGESDPSPYGAVDLSKIIVYPPLVGDLVFGRGGPGSVASADIQCVRVSQPVTRTNNYAQLNADGSFQFSLGANSEDVLEFTPATECSGKGELGDPVYYAVPTTFPNPQNWVCCQPQGTCQRETDFDMNQPCPSTNEPGTVRCADDNSCANLTRETIPLRDGNIRVSAPDQNGRIDVEGLFPVDGQGGSVAQWNLALVTMQNRQQLGIGGGGSSTLDGIIADENGRFVLKDRAAKGDDELVFQLFDVSNVRSVQHRVLVPDSKLVGLDVLGAFPLTELNGTVATVGLRLNPLGEDGRGICADDLGTPEDPRLCLTGGLQQEHVQIESWRLAQMNGGNPVANANPRASGARLRRGTYGDPLRRAQHIMVVIDMSRFIIEQGMMATRTICRPGDRGGIRFQAVERILENTRARDKVGLVAYGFKDPPYNRVVLPPTGSDGNWSAQRAALNNLKNEQSVGGQSDVLGGMWEASRALWAAQAQEGNIVVLSFCDDRIEPIDPDMREKTIERFLRLGYREGSEPEGWIDDKRDDFISFRTYVLGVDLPQNVSPCDVMTCATTDIVEQAAEFADGHMEKYDNVPDLLPAAANLAARIAGSYELLYDIDVPLEAGKSVQAEIQATVTIDGVQARGTWRGTIDFK